MYRWRVGLGCGIVCQMTADENSPGGWDFFISYTQADRAWAEWIAWILEEDGHRVLVQAWDFVPGTNWVQGMQAGTRDAPSRSCPPYTWSRCSAGPNGRRHGAVTQRGPAASC